MIDEATALEMVGGDYETLQELKGLLAQETPPLVREMSNALASRTFDALRVAAHTFKGMYLVFAPNPAEALALEIEACAARGDAAAAERTLAQLPRAIADVYKALGMDQSLDTGV